MDKDLFYKMIKKNQPDEALMPIQAGSYATMCVTDLMLNMDIQNIASSYNKRNAKKLKFNDVLKVGEMVLETALKQTFLGNEVELGRKDRILFFEELTKSEKEQLKVGKTCFGFPLSYKIKLPTLKGNMIKAKKIYGVPIDDSWLIFKKETYEKNLS